MKYRRRGAPKDRYWLHIVLFLITFFTCVYAGAQYAGRHVVYDPLSAGWLADGLRYAIPLLLFLTFHEFGHYFAARYHNVRTSLPYYIPFLLFFWPFNIGTFGAVIRIREAVPSARKLFDIGVWGPISGFVVAVAVILYAVATLPPPTYLLTIPGHEAIVDQWLTRGELPREWAEPMTLHFGQTPLFWILSHFVADLPPLYEIYHYPVLFAGWLGLLFTALNLLPVGQLDGGHIWYAMVGSWWHGIIARCMVLMLLLSATLGFMIEVLPGFAGLFPNSALLGWVVLGGILVFFFRRIFPGSWVGITLGPVLLMLASVLLLVGVPGVANISYFPWFIWCLLIVLVIRVDHPPVLYAEPLSTGRYVLGILSLVIFVLCFSIRPVYFS